MAEEHPATDVQQDTTEQGNRQAEIESLKAVGLYKPGLVETFEQARKFNQGREEKFNQWSQEIGRRRAQKILEPLPKTGEEPNPETSRESTPSRGEILDRVNTALNSLHIAYPNFGKYEDEITSVVLNDPYYRKQVDDMGMYGVMESLYFNMRGKEAHQSDIKSRKEEELEQRRKDVGRLGEGAPQDRSTLPSDPSVEIVKKLQKAAQDRESMGTTAFEKKYGSTFASYTEDLRKKLSEIESQ